MNRKRRVRELKLAAARSQLQIPSPEAYSPPGSTTVPSQSAPS